MDNETLILTVDIGNTTIHFGIYASGQIIAEIKCLSQAQVTKEVQDFLAEYAQKPIIRVIPFLVQALGALFFLLAKDPVFLWLAVTVYGLGFSGVLVTQEVVWANFFGRLSLGLVRSLGYLAAFGFGAVGPIAMNAVFDIMGSYRPAFMVIIFLFIFAAILMAIARPAKAKRYATATEIAPPSGRRPH